MAEIVIVSMLGGLGALVALAIALRHTWCLEQHRHRHRTRPGTGK